MLSVAGNGVKELLSFFTFLVKRDIYCGAWHFVAVLDTCVCLGVARVKEGPYNIPTTGC